MPVFLARFFMNFDGDTRNSKVQRGKVGVRKSVAAKVLGGL